MAKLLPIALPPIVRDAIVAATVREVIKGLKLKSLTKIAAIVVAAAPDIIPQMSPITSQQNLILYQHFS